MKPFLFILVSFFFTLNGVAQNIVFNKLDSTTWLSAPNINDSMMQYANQILLKEYKLPKDTIKEKIVVWDFKAGLLTISYFNFQQQKKSKIGVYKYRISPDKRILTIYIHNKAHAFIVGITSTANNVLLIRMQKG